MGAKSKGRKIFVVLLLIAFLFAMVKGYISNLDKPVNINSTDKITVEIQPGSSGKTIAKILKTDNLIKNERYFTYYSKKNKLDNFKSGVYEFSKSQSLEDILILLNKGGRDFGEKVTIPEGYNINQIADVLAKKELIDKEKFISLTNDKSQFENEYPFLKDNSIVSLEGFMYPETYFIEKGTDEKDIIRKFLNQTKDEFKKADITDENSKLNEYVKNINDLITLSSIVEKETSVESEKSLIAGVFMKRLKINMPLQSCVTVEYVLGKHKERISFEDSKVKSEFNTYINKGLPPHPICTPTVDTINAVKKFEDTDYLYFVAKKDGTHVFSKTYNQHLEATKNIYGEY